MSSHLKDYRLFWPILKGVQMHKSTRLSALLTFPPTPYLSELTSSILTL